MRHCLVIFTEKMTERSNHLGIADKQHYMMSALPQKQF